MTDADREAVPAPVCVQPHVALTSSPALASACAQEASSSRPCPHAHATGHAHAHDHSTGHAHVYEGPDATKRMGRAFWLIAVVLVVECVAAIMSHSLALMADAGHVLTDLVALALSWFALHQAARPPTAQRTFGFHRTGIMVAVFNSVSLLFIALFIAHEALARMFLPVAVKGPTMMGAAFVGLVVNLWIGHDLAAQHGENLNVRSALLHVLGDAAASLGVVIGAAFIWWRPTLGILDPIIAVLIALLVAYGAWQILHDATVVLMEGVPPHIDLHEVRSRILQLPGVDGVHDLHVWSISVGLSLLTCHVVLHETDVVTTAAVLRAVHDAVAHDFGIAHATLQPEWELCGPEGANCLLATSPDQACAAVRAARS